MQVAEAKKSQSSAAPIQAKRQPFFSREGEAGFFTHSPGKESSFFRANSVQPKLTIGAPDDQYEKEADSVADKVVQKMGEPMGTKGFKGDGDRHEDSGILRRKCENCEEEEKLQKKEKPLLAGITRIQRKPIFESNAEQEPGLQAKFFPAAILQSKCSSCREEENVQKKGSAGNGSGDLGNRLSQSRGKGSPMPQELRGAMGAGFGTDFSAVRIHTGSQAIQMAEELNAQAFTHGSDIYFNRGKYDPSSTSGKHLLAHELTHTVQQGAVKTGDSPGVQKKSDTSPIQLKTNAHPSNQATAIALPPAPALQMKCDECEQEAKDEKLQKLQLKLTAAASDDAGDTNPPSIQRRTPEMEKTEYPIMFSVMPDIHRIGQSSSPAGSREAVVAEAQKMLGKIEAKKDDGSGRRVGAEQLLEIFHLAAKDAWPDQVVEGAGQEGLPHWCGIFSVYAIKKAGIDLGYWRPGQGVGDTLQPTADPQPGDVAYFHEKQHHAIVKSVDGDSIQTIDGNSGNFSEVTEKTRSRSSITGGFMTAFTGAEKGIQPKAQTTVNGQGVSLSTKAENAATNVNPEVADMENGHGGTPNLQREGEGIGSKIWNATGGKLVNAAGEAIKFTESIFWEVVERFGNTALVNVLRQIKKEGVLGFFKGKVMQAVDTIFHGLHNTSDKLFAIFPQFGALVLRARTIVSALAKGDCKPLFAALNELKDVITELAGKAWDAVVDFFQPAIDFFSKIWNSLALPALEWIKEKAGHVWNWIKKIGKDIWDWYAPVRKAVGAAWDWLKGILGLNADETGEEGLIQWAQRKVEAVWEEVKAKLKPIIEPAKQLVAKIKMLLPLTAILNLRKTIQDWMKKVVATATTMGEDASNVQNEGVQTSLRDQILPAVQQAIERFRGSIAEAAVWVNGKIGAIFNSVSQFFSSVRSISWLSLAVSAINWVETKALEVKDWVSGKVTDLFDLVSQGVHRFGEFLRPIYDGLMKILEVLGNLLGRLPDFLMGPLWMILPACIKDPIKKFLIEQILSRMPFFQKLQKVENIWERLQNAAIAILKQIFVDGNLRKAIWSFFSTMLDIIGIPPQLVTRVLAKGAQVLNDILEDPLGFLGNFIRALKMGFEQFFGKIGSYLLKGLQAWLFSQLEGTDIEMPKDFSFRSMLKLVFQVLGITVDMIAEQIQKVFPEKRGLKAKIIKFASAFGKVWDFFERILTDDGQGGSVWDRLEREIGNLWEMILDGVAGWLEGTIVKKALAWVATKLDPTGVMAVITTVIDVFNVLQAVADKAREILEMVEKVLDGLGDLIKGIIGAAATVFEKALGASIPVVLALLASLFGLDGVVDQIKETIKKIRLKVEQGVEKIIRAIKGFVERVLGKGDEDKEDSIDAALAEIETEGEKEMDEGEVKKDEAELIKNKVNQDHPSVINITSVKDEEEFWDFEYVQLAKKQISKKLVPPTIITPLPESNRPKRVIANPLTSKKSEAYGPGKKEGSRAIVSGNKLISNWISKTGSKRPQSSVLGVHILAHHLHGPWSSWNIVFGARSLNEQMKGPEKLAKDNKEFTLEYDMTVDYFEDSNNDDLLEQNSNPSNSDVKKALGYYIAKSITGPINKINIDNSRTAIGMANAQVSQFPVLVDEPNLSEETLIINLLNNNKIVGQTIRKNGITYTKTSFSSFVDIARSPGVQRNTTAVNAAIRDLISNQQVIKEGNNYYVK